MSCDLWVARAYCRVLGRGAWGMAVQCHLLSLEGENSVDRRCFIADDGHIVNLVGLKPGGIPYPSMWRLLCGLVEPAAIVALAAAIQKELTVLGLRWDSSFGRWDLDVERMVLTLQGGAVGVSGGSALASDFQATHSEDLRQLQEFGKPRAVAFGSGGECCLARGLQVAPQRASLGHARGAYCEQVWREPSSSVG